MTCQADQPQPGAAGSPRAHGTAARYNHGPRDDGRPGGCRCGECRAAIAACRRATRASGPATVDAAPVVAHVRQLQAQGTGWTAAALAAKVAPSTVSRLLYGIGGRPPAGRVRAETAAAILAVRPAGEARTTTSAAGTCRRVQALIAAGHPPAAVAAALGMTARDMLAMLGRDRVRISTAARVRDVFERMWDQAPDESGPEAAAAAEAARDLAAGRGWAPAMAWDDEPGDEHFIDDPAARPAPGWMRSGRIAGAALVEDAEFIIATQHAGLSGREARTLAAGRLGTTFERLDRAYHRQAAKARAAESLAAPHGAGGPFPSLPDGAAGPAATATEPREAVA